MAGSACTDAADRRSEATKSTRTFSRQLAAGIAVLSLALLCLGSASASADGQGDTPQLTDPQAAAQLPHQDLGRSEALELITGVFEAVLQSPAGPFDELQVEKFLSDSTAVIAAGDQPDQAGVPIGDEATGDQYEGPTMIDSTVPLQTKNSQGKEEVVDLGLEQSEGELQPSNPLVEVGIPQELGEGIQFPDLDIQIELAGGPQERSPSTVEESVAVYPNVAQDTDLAVAPTPTGLETMTQLRSKDAPTSQTFDLDLPVGARIEATQDGGAEILSGTQTLMSILPPSAIDANGAMLPTALDVGDHSLTLTVTPGPQAAFPILVDPQYKADYLWNTKHTTSFADWVSGSNTSSIVPATAGAQGEFNGSLGLAMRGISNTAITSSSEGNWFYNVPRFSSDLQKYGTWPQSFITSMTLQKLGFWRGAHESKYSPYLISGIWDPAGAKWTSMYKHGGNEGSLTFGPTYIFSGGGNENAKQALGVGLRSTEAFTLPGGREAYVGTATVEVGDNKPPGFGTWAGPANWVNAQATSPITFVASDAGLGMSRLSVLPEGWDSHNAWPTNLPCAGSPSDPCPYTWASSDLGTPALYYNPASLPQGEDWLELIAQDLVGNTSTVKAKVKVDHTVPGLSLSGAMTEQATLGKTLPRYMLKLSATDGTTEQPQSGVSKTVVKVDSKVVDESAPGCTTKNCQISREWPLESSAYAVGQHTVEVIATDAVGLSTTKKLTIEIQRDTTAPQLTANSTFFTAPEGWLEQKSYFYTASAADVGGYGITSLVLKIDGMAVQTKTQGCPNGACGASISKSINMATYKGGAHPAELITTDGAGNTTTKNWTISIDPKGDVPVGEAIDTLEAVEATSELTPVAPSDQILDPAEIEQGNNPSLVESGGELQSTGTAAPSVVALDPTEGFTVQTPSDEISITPAAVSEGADPMTIASGDAGVSANSGAGVDSVVRPIYDGVMSFAAIRDSASPEDYSWEVALNSGLYLSASDEHVAEIYYEDGTPAMMISAEEAHDATGKAVPTTLSVSGNVITLKVPHKGGGFVYPILAGSSFRADYKAVQIIYPPPPPPPAEPPSDPNLLQLLAEHPVIYTHAYAPVVVKGPESEADEATISKGRTTYKLGFEMDQCLYDGPVGCWVARQTIAGYFFYNGKYAWYKGSQPHPSCPGSSHIGEISLVYCNWSGANHQKYGGGRHITAQVFWNYNAGFTKPNHLTVEMYGSGGVYGVDSACVCNPKV